MDRARRPGWIGFMTLFGLLSSAWTQTLSPDKIHFEYRQLTDSLAVAVIPAVPNEPDGPPFMNGEPQHLRILFDNAPVREYFAPETPQLLVYPLAEYGDLYKNPERREFDRQIRELDSLLKLPENTIPAAIPVLPAVEAEQNFALHVQKLSFSGGEGLRFITMYSQDAAPITNERIFYTFQGLTADHRYYVAFYYPLHSARLPDSDAQILTAMLAVLSDPQQYAAYQSKTVSELKKYPESEFAPRLSALDSVISTLSIAP
jgi:hypothetical protein